MIAVNNSIADVIRRYGVEEGRLRVIQPFAHRAPDPSVVVPKELEAFAANSDPFLISVGLLEPEYDLELQIEAMREVLVNFPNAGLMILGSGSLDKHLKQNIADKDYASRIFLAGDVPHAVTLELIGRADILLRTTTFDGDAISVREALFLGTPVIATDNGMRPDGVNLMQVGDQAALVGVIKSLVSAGKPDRRPLKPDVSNIEAVLALYDELAGHPSMTPVKAVG